MLLCPKFAEILSRGEDGECKRKEHLNSEGSHPICQAFLQMSVNVTMLLPKEVKDTSFNFRRPEGL